LDIYALSYNVLRIDKGITQLLFNTKWWKPVSVNLRANSKNDKWTQC
jgi:hypothetical protein